MFSLGELAQWIDGEVVGNPDLAISGVRSLQAAGPEDLAPFTDPRYRDQLEASRAGAVLVAERLTGVTVDQLVCAETGWALATILQRFDRPSDVVRGRHATAVVDPSASIDESASVGALVSIGARAVIEADVVIHPGAVVGADCTLGEGTVLHPRVVLYPGTQLGRRVIVHAGAVLGSDGFGYAPHAGRLMKVPQIGRLVIEDGVEIGANSTLDRATLDETRIGASSKLDNLVHVGHNVRLGEGCVLCGQVGIAGSTEIGRGVVLGGQAGAGDHLKIGDGVQVAGRGAVLQDVEAGQKVGGVPAQDLRDWKRQSFFLRRIPELFRRVKVLERSSENEGRSEDRSE